MVLECPRCGTPVTGDKTQAQCSNCGLRLSQDDLSRPVAIIVDYFDELRRIIFKPTAYFKKMPGGLRGGRVTRALGFAIATHWLGAVIGYFWRAVGSGIFRDYSNRFTALFEQDVNTIRQLGGETLGQSEMREHLMNWFFGMGAVIADPFLTLGQVFFTAFLIYIAARILVPSDRTSVSDITFESTVKIVAYGMSPSIFAVIPGFGAAVAPLAVIIVTIIGIREVYQVGTGRAVLIGLFPKLLFVGIILMGVLVFTASVLKLLFSVF